MPIRKNMSNIIDDGGIQLITMNLPPLIRMREWVLLHSIDIHGCSMNTFYKNVEERDNTVILVENENSEVFGCFMTEEWHQSRTFYGCGDGSFVFRIKKIPLKENGPKINSDIDVYDPTYENDRFQYSDRTSLTIGASDKGGSALYIGSNFKSGYSGPNDTFTNPVLTSEKDFLVKRFEIWGFDYL